MVTSGGADETRADRTAMVADAPPARLTVALVVLPETTPGVIYSLHEILAAVGTSWAEVTGEEAPCACRFHPVLASVDGAAVRSAGGVPIVVETALGDLGRVDIALVTDLSVDMTADPRGRWPAAAAWLGARHEEGTLVTSVCTGALLLAEAGLLDGLEATTHWAAIPIFRDYYPAVRLQAQRILCPAGAGHGIVTSGGAGSYNALALYLVARFAGSGEAQRVARLFLIGDLSEGQLPFAGMARPRNHDDRVIGDVQAWIADHYAVPRPVAEMARRAGLTERTFTRRFRRATGYAPTEYVLALRMEEAKQMLETTSESTERVGSPVGYADTASFRRLFKRMVGVTPARYRQRFGRAGRMT